MLQFTRARNRGFTLIEISIVLLIIGIVMSGFLMIATASIANRHTADLNTALEAAKVTAVLTAINNKEVARICVSGPLGCDDTGCTASPSSPCATYSSLYNVPSTIPAANDPWGRPLSYTRQQPTVTSSLSPTAPVFTVTSFGADGLIGSDDISRTVTASEFISIVTKMGL